MTVNQEAIEKHGVRPFDAAEYLDDDEVIGAYLSEILADGDMDELLEALGEVARARGMTRLAEDTGLGRESLYKALTPGAKPRFDTINRILKGLGINLRAEPVEPQVTRTAMATYTRDRRPGMKAGPHKGGAKNRLKRA
ncbi:putative addiction module antidote protein [Marinobacter pelagius]|uniref:Putative addiction module antidote protein n=1 Tax=Marinobacter pelagius TaxID=379482 RepID=A0A366GSM2_9GAMM|nr:putative addiction module antidote protein [Marinobacter pelagius]